jgi:hypothetical protein
MTWLKNIWGRLPEAWRKEIVSISHTFVTVFIAAVYTEYTMGHVMWSRTALAVVCIAAGRSAWKAVVNEFIAWWKARQ